MGVREAETVHEGVVEISPVNRDGHQPQTRVAGGMQGMDGIEGYGAAEVVAVDREIEPGIGAGLEATRGGREVTHSDRAGMALG